MTTLEVNDTTFYCHLIKSKKKFFFVGSSICALFGLSDYWRINEVVFLRGSTVRWARGLIKLKFIEIF